MVKIVLSSEINLKEVLNWLKKEQRNSGSAFYCNKEIIVDSHNKGEVFVAIKNDATVGFIVAHLHEYSNGASIDILEVHPKFRRLGIGKELALNTITRLFNNGAEKVDVQCAPRSSEAFWIKLGFIPKSNAPINTRENPRLELKNQEIKPFTARRAQ